MIQLDLFGEPADPLEDLQVQLPDACPGCNNPIALIGRGSGPHRASLHCDRCGGHRGWIAHQTYDFLITITKKFGRPHTPIVIRRGNVVWRTATGSSGVEAALTSDKGTENAYCK
jgi:hypothetical protein